MLYAREAEQCFEAVDDYEWLCQCRLLIARHLMRSCAFSAALAMLNSIADWIRKTNNELAIARYQWLKAEIFVNEDKLAEAQRELQAIRLPAEIPTASKRQQRETKSAAHEKGERLRLHLAIKLCLGDVCFNLGAFSAAMEHYSKAAEAAQLHNDQPAMYYSHCKMAHIFESIGDLETARAHYLWSRQGFQQISPHRASVFAEIGLGKLSYKMGHFHEALEYFENCLNRKQDGPDNKSRSKLHIHLSEIHLQLGDCVEVVRNLNKSLEFCRANNSVRHIALSQTLLARACAKFPSLANHAPLADEFWRLMKTMSSKYCLMIINNQLAAYFESLNEADKAFNQFKKHVALRSELLSFSSLTEIIRIADVWSFTLLSTQPKDRVNRCDRALNARRQNQSDRLDTSPSEFEHIIRQLEIELQLAGIERKQQKQILDGLVWRKSEPLHSIERIQPPINNRVHDYKLFAYNIQQFPDLTPMEMELCAMLIRKMSSQEIADELHVSVHTVHTHRRRIRKKLGLRRSDNLTTRLQSLAAYSDSAHHSKR